MRRSLRFAVPTIFVAILLVLTGTAVAAETSETDNWPQFRGGDAMSAGGDDPRLPITWSTTENVAWKAVVPGLGWSAPVVWGNHVIVTTVVTDGTEPEPKKGLYFPDGSPGKGGMGKDEMEPPSDKHHWLVYSFALDTGELNWKKEVAARSPKSVRHIKNSYASETPVTDGKNVYAYFGNQGVYALDLETGETKWEREFETVATRMGWGTAASPVLFENLLFIINDNDDQSWLAALDTETGEEEWRVNREEGSNWATPYVWQNELRTEVITPGTDVTRSYDLEGGLLWEMKRFSDITIPQPFSAHGLLYVTSGYVGNQHRPVYAIKPGAKGDITLEEGHKSNEYVVWYQPQAGPYNPTPLVLGDYYFTLYDQGFYTVHNAKTGEEMYFTEKQKESKQVKRRVARGAGAFTASPWSYNNRVFVLSEDGDTYVLDPEQGFEVVHTNSLDEMALATPAIAQGSLFLRTRGHLYRLTTEAK